MKKSVDQRPFPEEQTTLAPLPWLHWPPLAPDPEEHCLSPPGTGEVPVLHSPKTAEIWSIDFISGACQGIFFAVIAHPSMFYFVNFN